METQKMTLGEILKKNIEEKEQEEIENIKKEQEKKQKK